MTNVMTEISIGELIDKITILDIKSARLDDPAQLANIRTELEVLRRTRDAHVTHSTDLDDMTAALKAVNEVLWDIKNGVRDHERRKVFDDRFIEQVRSVCIEKRQGLGTQATHQRANRLAHRLGIILFQVLNQQRTCVCGGD